MSDVPPPTRRARKEKEVDTEAPAPERTDAPPPVEEEDGRGRLATAQLEMAAFGDHLIPYAPPVPKPPLSLAPWALTVSIAALLSSFFWGWLLPVGVVAVIVSIVSLRRPGDSTRVAAWALTLALAATVFSAGWLVWGFAQLPPA